MSPRVFSVLAALALTMIVATAVFRAQMAWHIAATGPGIAITSGCEEESFHTLWRQHHGLSVYSDPTQPPYSEAYFNWLFYQSYGAATKPFVTAQGDAALIRFGRLFTMAGTIIGAISLGLFGWHITGPNSLGTRLCAIVLTTFTFLGPLPGWWIVTVRPDLWATTLECLGLIALLLVWRRSALLVTTVTGSCFYAAWAFKHNYIQALSVSLLFLLWQRQWRTAASLLLFSLSTWSLTFLALGSDYRSVLLATTSANTFDLHLGWTNFSGALVRLVPLALPAICLLFMPASPNESQPIKDTLGLSRIGLPITLLLSFVGSCKIGAASNYFFTPMVFLTLLALIALARARSVVPPLLGLVPALALCGYLFLSPSLDLRPQARTMATRWALWKDAPSPRYSEDRSLNLPWLNPGEPVFLTGFKYTSYREHGRIFADDGIGGLISQRYFATLLLPTAVSDTHDGASLDGYRRSGDAAGFTLWRRTTHPDERRREP
jgi:hypothetical protein